MFRRSTSFSFAITTICTLCAIIPATRQQCGGSCGGSVEISVTQFGSVVIPCGNMLPSNNTRVNYCNETSNSPLALGTDVSYNLTEAQIYQNGNTLYCGLETQNIIYCYRLNVFYTPYLPSDYRPVRIGPNNLGRQLALECPLISNPPPVCNWSRYDATNTRQEVVPGNSIGFGLEADHCVIVFFPLRERHSGLYECTASNEIGTTTFTFTDRINVEDCFAFSTVPPIIALNRPPSNLSVGDNTTLTCRVSSLTRHTTLLMWTVDNVTYNTSGTFNSSRGQIVLSYSTFDSVTCSKSSNLTIFNVRMDSEGIYKCTTIQNNYVVEHNVPLVVSSNTQTSSTSSGSAAAVIGGAIAGATIFLLVLTGLLMVVAFLLYRQLKTDRLRNQLHESECCGVETSYVNRNDSIQPLKK